MFECRLQSNNPLPERLNRFNVLKAQAEMVAERLRSHYPEHAERIEHCCDLLRVKTFPNGWRDLDAIRLRYCKVRGCPICERNRAHKNIGRVYAGLKRAGRQYPGREWLVITLSIDAVEVPGLKQAIEQMHHSQQMLVKLLSFRSVGYAVFTDCKIFMDQATLTVTVLALVSCGGKNYLTQGAWQQLWEQSLRSSAPPIRVQRMKRNYSAICQALYSLGMVDLASIPEHHLQSYFCAIHRTEVALH